MLSTSVLLGQSQKQLSVTLNVPNEKSTLCCLSSKFFEYLFCFCWTRWFVLPIMSSKIIVVYQYLNKFKFYEAKIFCKLSLNIIFDFVTWTLQCIWEQKGTVTWFHEEQLMNGERMMSSASFLWLAPGWISAHKFCTSYCLSSPGKWPVKWCDDMNMRFRQVSYGLSDLQGHWNWCHSVGHMISY